jgi:hypothetical protein
LGLHLLQLGLEGAEPRLQPALVSSRALARCPLVLLLQLLIEQFELILSFPFLLIDFPELRL